MSAATPVAKSTSPKRQPFGIAPDGTPVELFTFANRRGIEMRVITFGGIIVSLRTPDLEGRFDDIVLGHDDVDGYVRSSSYFGAIIGRYGNRIARGRFNLDGVGHQLSLNDGVNHLHGGARGFDKVVWLASPFDHDGVRGLTLAYRSPDGEEGYPGTLNARVTYTLTDRDELVIDYHATSDRPTPVNLTQHTYWNLAGEGCRDVLDHELTIFASRFTPVDATLIPTGAVAPVADTPFDFRRPTRIGARINQEDAQLRHAGGYDHNFALDQSTDDLTHAVRLFDPTTGRVLDIYTSEPGIQFYSGNFLDGSARGKSGRGYAYRTGLCLETQHFPDSPNHPHFPSTVLRPGAEYRSRTLFRFTLREGAGPS